MWIDTHCHLEMLDADPEEVVTKSKGEGVSRLITIGTDKKSNDFVNEFVTSDDSVFGSLGFHPHDAKDFDDSAADFIIKNAAGNKKVLAVGECGLDYHYELSPKKTQKEVFETQLEIALELNLPVVVHTREAEKDTKASMTSFLKRGGRAVFHSFTSSWDLAKFGLDYGVFISFNGIATFKNAGEVRDVVSKTPQESILVETDSPFLTPVPHRGKKNYPGFVRHTGEYLAKLLGSDIQEFAELTSKNAFNLFQFPI